ncbi:MAG: hypothetical protein ACF8PG_03420 [Maioricimonas sp. JB045]
MQMMALTCPHCAAPLDLPARLHRARCDYCGCQLLLSEGDFVEQRAEQAPPAPVDDRVRSELDQLDREWQAYRRTYLPRDSNGEYFVPDPEQFLHLAWGTGAFSVILVIGFLVMGMPTGAIVTAGLSAAIIFGVNRQRHVGQVYQRSLANYQNERLKLMQAAES